MPIRPDRDYKQEAATNRKPKRAAENRQRKRDRAAWVKANGPIPEGWTLEHKDMISGKIGPKAKGVTPMNRLTIKRKKDNFSRQPPKKTRIA